MNVEFVPFHSDVRPLVVHNCDKTSRREEGSLILMAYLGETEEGGI
jgi:hypothetical protein